MDGNESGDDLRIAVARMLDRHWVDDGYCAPNSTTYPFQWLWDSCFHSLIWAELGDERAVTEVDTALSVQSADGFVPHMNYVRNPSAHASLWGRTGASSITQPPMFGHAVAELVRRRVPVPDATLDRATLGLGFLLTRRRRHSTGLVELCHPWESGADDSPRWDDSCPGGFELERWRERKSDLVAAIVRNEHGSPVASEAFAVASAGFNALVAFNAFELSSITNDDRLRTQAVELSEALAGRWDGDLVTWIDAGPTEGGSARVRSLDGLLALLVERDEARIDAVIAELFDPSAYGGVFGPTGVHREEPTYAADAYWRGPAWPQLSYLLWVALDRAGRVDAASSVAEQLASGAVRSGLAEYWNADTAAGYGAIPQSWSGLAIIP